MDHVVLIQRGGGEAREGWGEGDGSFAGESDEEMGEKSKREAHGKRQKKNRRQARTEEETGLPVSREV